MSRPATPQLRTAYDLQDVLRADFLDHRLAVAVEVGEWDPEMLRGQARVMITLEDGTIGQPTGHYQPGAWWPVDATHVARPILDNAQGYLLRIHAPAPTAGADANSARGAHLATDQLLRQTAAAIGRQIAATLRAPIRVHWPKSMPDYPAFVHGSMCEAHLIVGSPILDDKVILGSADELQVVSSFLFPDGSETSTSTNTEPA